MYQQLLLLVMSLFFYVFHKLCLHKFLFLGDNIYQDFVYEFFLFFT